MSQTKRQSVIETVVSTAAGFLFSLLVQTVLVWSYNVPMDYKLNLWFVFWFTLASLVRGYSLRRFFNWLFRS